MWVIFQLFSSAALSPTNNLSFNRLKWSFRENWCVLDIISLTIWFVIWFRSCEVCFQRFRPTRHVREDSLFCLSLPLGTPSVVVHTPLHCFIGAISLPWHRVYVYTIWWLAGIHSFLLNQVTSSNFGDLAVAMWHIRELHTEGILSTHSFPLARRSCQ